MRARGFGLKFLRTGSEETIPSVLVFVCFFLISHSQPHLHIQGIVFEKIKDSSCFFHLMCLQLRLSSESL